MPSQHANLRTQLIADFRVTYLGCSKLCSSAKGIGLRMHHPAVCVKMSQIAYSLRQISKICYFTHVGTCTILPTNKVIMHKYTLFTLFVTCKLCTGLHYRQSGHLYSPLYIVDTFQPFFRENIEELY